MAGKDGGRLKPVRIFQIANHIGFDRGGAERLACSLHRGLLDNQVDAEILAIESFETAEPAASASLGFSNPRDLRALWRLDKALRGKVQPGDIVHAHLFPSTLYVSLLKQAGRIACPVWMTEHNTWNRRRDTGGGRTLDRLIYRGFDGIVAISEATRDALLDTYPHLSGKARVVENGVDLKHAQFLQRSRGPGPLRVVSLGRLAHAKNLDGALRALALLGRDDWSYRIVGDGPERQALEDTARRLGISQQVEFAGHVGNVWPELERADLFLMPSRWDGFGLAAVEAMNVGLPLVISDVPGLREVVGGAAVSPVPIERDELLAKAIATLLDDPDLRERLGRNAFARSLQFSSERMLGAYLELWKSAAGADGGA